MSISLTSKTKHILLGATTAAVLLLGYGYIAYSNTHPNTDDAYVNANIVNIAAQVSGPVNQVFVQNNQLVKQGQLLFTIDPSPFQIAVNRSMAALELAQQNMNVDNAEVKTAQAKLAQAQAELMVQEQNVPRILTLVSKGEMSKADGADAQGKLDNAKAAYDAAQGQLQQAIQALGASGKQNAQVQQAYANLASDQLNLQHTKIYAPSSGYLVNFSLQPGTMVTAQQALFALVQNNLWWVDSNFKETDLANIRVGQPATIELDTYPGVDFKGKVDSISSGSGAAFSILPPENATGNWVKVTQRFTVKVVFVNPPPQYPLRVGASSTVTINTK